MPVHHTPNLPPVASLPFGRLPGLVVFLWPGLLPFSRLSGGSHRWFGGFATHPRLPMAPSLFIFSSWPHYMAFIHPPTHPSTHPSIHPSIHPSSSIHSSSIIHPSSISSIIHHSSSSIHYHRCRQCSVSGTISCNNAVQCCVLVVLPRADICILLAALPHLVDPVST